MQYTTRLGSSERRAHVNYQCPCGCVGGVIYSAGQPLSKAGACCCGRKLWVGSEAEAMVRPYLEPDIEYEWDLRTVALPWGEIAEAAMAWPPGSVEAKLAEKAAHAETLVRDVVCGMMIEPSGTAASSMYQGATYYFCAESCKASFDANPGAYVKRRGLIGRLLRRPS